MPIKSNGRFIGVSKSPNVSSTSGIYTINEVFVALSGSSWPRRTPPSVEVLVVAGGGGGDLGGTGSSPAATGVRKLPAKELSDAAGNYAAVFVEAFNKGADGVLSSTYMAKMDQSLLQLRSKIAVSDVNVRRA